ncbi:hypothetical protein BKK79_19870 [Cupriavidus sp. USMAA2-4]|uniref:hypothetical protein n=1 Tax=Cupriavidus sp. USMAA2-4 TaxID=876364 RepID=UPI0008A6C150|nr:hypothetical protein [Cupriavidus sp. USMAA2-4]AOY93805.1 hypothetical protein BKK79_19870 [Cupriavidus sp. USMAA2-4]
MADAKFGPWEACSNLIREKRTADSSAGFLVAEVPANTEGASAKAALMAAAPELLEALADSANSRLRYDPEFSRGYYASKNGQPRNLQAEGKEWHEGYDAFSAIAKATGERA